MTFLLFCLIEQDVLTLKEKVFVTERYIRLLDCVEDNLSNGIKEALKNVYLGKAPAKNEKKRITPDDIIIALHAKGIQTKISFEGAKEVIVEFGEEIKKVKDENLTHMEILLEIKHYLRKNLSSNFSVKIIDIYPDNLPGDLHIITIEPAGKKLTGDVLFKLELSLGRKASVITSVRLKKKVIVASRAIPVNSTITPKDIDWAEVEVEEEGNAMTASDGVLGSKTLRKLSKGEVIQPSDVKLKPVVKRNQTLRAKGKFIETTARALEDGALGQIIECEYTSTKAKFRAKVVSGELVTIVTDDPTKE